MISCSEAVRRLWEYLDDDLQGDDRQRIDDHLAFCRRCCGEAEFAVELRRLLTSAATPRMPSDVERRLTDFLDTLEEGTS